MKWTDISTDYPDRLRDLRNKKPHEVLNVSPDATLAEVKLAYRNLVKIYHPDKSHAFLQRNNSETLKIIINAYNVMSKLAR